MRASKFATALRAAALLLLLALAAPGAPSALREARPAKAPAPLAALDAHVARVMREFDVPGVAVAVVKDGRVVLAKGYGVRRVGEPAAVDADTQFGIASNTKAFTCAALSILAEEGQAVVGRPGHEAPAGVPHERPVGHARGHGARPRHAPRRPRARPGRPDVVAVRRRSRGRRSSAASRSCRRRPACAAATRTTTSCSWRRARWCRRRPAAAGTSSCASGSSSRSG